MTTPEECPVCGSMLWVDPWDTHPDVECALRAELRDVKAERDRLRTAIRINADELRDLRAAVLAVADQLGLSWSSDARNAARALREAVGK